MADELQPLLGELHLNDTFSRADVQNVESLIKDKLGERGYGSATLMLYQLLMMRIKH